MMAHCTSALESAINDKPLPRDFMGRIFGKMAKSVLTNEKPFKKNLPTSKHYLVTEPVDFDKEKARLIDVVTRFSKGGPAQLDNKIHPFFGRMTAEEWSTSQLKHLDHHLRQFGA